MLMRRLVIPLASVLITVGFTESVHAQRGRGGGGRAGGGGSPALDGGKSGRRHGRHDPSVDAAEPARHGAAVGAGRPAQHGWDDPTGRRRRGPGRG